MFDKASNDPFSEGLVAFGSRASPCSRKNNDISCKSNSIFDSALGCPADQSITPFSSKSLDIQIGGLQVNSTSSIDSSSRSSPTSSLSGSSGTPGFGNNRIQFENINKGNHDLTNPLKKNM